MLAIFIIALSSKMQGVSNINSTVSVKTFYDYTVNLPNKGDVNIKVPQNTFILISSIDGYTAVVDKPESGSINIKPDPKNRLIFFKEAGFLKVTSIISNYKFTFHTLLLDIFDGFTFAEDYLIISTDTMEQFKFVSVDKPKDYYLWFISNKEIQGQVIVTLQFSQLVIFAYGLHLLLN